MPTSRMVASGTIDDIFTDDRLAYARTAKVWAGGCLTQNILAELHSQGLMGCHVGGAGLGESSGLMPRVNHRVTSPDKLLGIVGCRPRMDHAKA